MKKILLLLTLTLSALCATAQKIPAEIVGTYAGQMYFASTPDPKDTGQLSQREVELKDNNGLTIHDPALFFHTFKSVTIPVKGEQKGSKFVFDNPNWDTELESTNGISFQYAKFTLEDSHIEGTTMELNFAFILHNGVKLYGYFKGERKVTGINALTAPAATTKETYDLLGRRLAAPRKGIVIRGGKKIIAR